MKKIVKINVAKDYTKTPGIRYKIDGELSGEEFREKFLDKYFEDKSLSDVVLEIDLDGGYGYSPSFLEEAFGGLIRRFDINSEKLLQRLKFKSDEEPDLIDEINTYIKCAIKNGN